jgi:hypothetical protein
MSAVSLFHAPARRQMRPAIWPALVVAAALLAGFGAFGWSHPGLRGRLAAAAAELRSLPPDTAKPEVERLVAGAFAGRAVTVSASRFPDLVLVTVHGLDRDACLAAASDARRLEGLVVTELSGYDSAADCGPRNDMTWRIMP